LQPVDVGVAKPLKDKLRNQCESSIIEEEAVHDRTTKTDQPRRDCIDIGKITTPKREQVSMWTNKAPQSISTQKVQMHGVIETLVCFEKIFSISQQTLHNSWH